MVIKFMKIYIKNTIFVSLIGCFFLNTHSYAQIDIGKPGKNQVEQVKNTGNPLYDVAIYNGTLSGYAISCNTPGQNEKLLKDKLLNTVGSAKLNSVGLTNIDRYYDAAKLKASNTRLADNECISFNNEYNKILNSIK